MQDMVPQATISIALDIQVLVKKSSVTLLQHCYFVVVLGSNGEQL
jgi:hypothetical protein